MTDARTFSIVLNVSKIVAISRSAGGSTNIFTEDGEEYYDKRDITTFIEHIKSYDPDEIYFKLI